MKQLFVILLLLSDIAVYSQTVEDKLNFADSVYYSNPDTTFVICNEVESESKNQKHLFIRSQLCIARYYLLKADLETAGKLLNDIIELCTNTEDLKFLARVYKLKSNLLDRINRKEEGIEFLEKSIKTYYLAKDSLGAYGTTINLVLRYLDFKQYDKALETLEFLESKKDELGFSQNYFIYQNWAKYYLEISEPKNALPYVYKAIEVAEKNKMIDSQATIYMILCKTFLSLKRLDEAQSAIEKSVLISKNNNLMHELDEALKIQILLFEQQGKYKEAFIALKEKKEIENKIYDIERINKINYYDRKLQLAEHQREIAEKDLKLKNQEFSLNRSAYINRVMTAIILSVVIILSFIIWFSIKTKKLNKLLSEQTISIKKEKEFSEKQRKLVEAKNKEILDSIHYAKHIQQALLSSESYIERNLKRLKNGS